MKEDKVSIVVTYYNTAKFAESGIRSLIGQEYKNIEFVFVDDLSTDSTRSILKDFSQNDTRIKLILKEKNGGLSEARVTGIENATGNWILIMDGDDLLAPDAIRKFVDVAQNSLEIDIVYGQRIYSENPEKEQWGTRKKDIWMEEGKFFCERLYQDKRIDTPLVGKLYRAEYLKKINIKKYRTQCPQIFFEDILMTPMVLYYAQKVAILPDPYWIHREVPTSISRSGILWDFYYDQIESGNILLSFFKAKGLEKPWKIFISKYMKIILRIWCLIDYYDMAEEKRNNLKQKIQRFYNYYYFDYIKYGKSSWIEKLIYSGFAVSKEKWKNLILATKYRGYQTKR